MQHGDVLESQLLVREFKRRIRQLKDLDPKVREYLDDINLAQ